MTSQEIIYQTTYPPPLFIYPTHHHTQTYKHPQRSKQKDKPSGTVVTVPERLHQPLPLLLTTLLHLHPQNTHLQLLGLLLQRANPLFHLPHLASRLIPSPTLAPDPSAWRSATAASGLLRELDLLKGPLLVLQPITFPLQKLLPNLLLFLQ